MKLASKVAIITGGGSGIGKASAYLFAEEGAKIVIAQRTVPAGEETVTTIKSRGGEAVFVRTDVTVASEVEHLIRATIDTFGKVDILFNNAGTLHKPTPVEVLDESLWDQVYAINVKSIFLGVKYAVPEMKKAGGGVIINNASILGVKPAKYTAAYSSSKGAANVLTRELALELAPHNIRVNCINPVAADTPMVRAAQADVDWDEWVEKRLQTIPIGRLCRPEDVAQAALYLAADESAMLTGTCINVDGGYGI